MNKCPRDPKQWTLRCSSIKRRKQKEMNKISPFLLQKKSFQVSKKRDKFSKSKVELGYLLYTPSFISVFVALEIL
jgi:hypothetical protein